MSEADRNLAEDRATRNAARGAFDSHLARLKGEVEEKGGIVGKVKDEAGKRLLDAGEQGLAIVSESKGIIAGTLAAIGLWLFRKPLVEAARGLFGASEEQADVQEDQANRPETDMEKPQ